MIVCISIGLYNYIFATMNKVAGSKILGQMLRNFCNDENQRLKDDIDLHKYSIDTGEEVTNATVQELCQLIPNIKRLDVTKCYQVSDVGLWCIASHCADTILHLVLSECNQMTHVGLRSISLACKNLLSLDFSYCKLLDDMAMTTIATGTWQLRVLILEGCIRISDSGIVEIARPLGKTLQVLNLNYCTKVGDFGSRGLIAIGKYCKHLRLLELKGCRRVEDAGLKAVANTCLKLEILKLSGCTAATGVAFKALFQNLAHLQTLELKNCTQLQDKDVKVCFDIVNNYNTGLRSSLTSVDFGGCDRLTDEGVYAICNSLGAALYHLNISGANITDVSSQIIASYCGRLRSLDLSNCISLTDNTVHNLSRNVSALTSLKLDGTRSKDVTMRTVMSYVTPNSKATGTDSKSLRSMNGGGMKKNISFGDTSGMALTRHMSSKSMSKSGSRLLPKPYTASETDPFPSMAPSRNESYSPTRSRLSTGSKVSKMHSGHDLPVELIPQTDSQLRFQDGFFDEPDPVATVHRTPSIDVDSLSNSYKFSKSIRGGDSVRNVQVEETASDVVEYAPQLEFAELATEWFGYKPKKGFDELIKGREQFRLHTKMALRIQGLIRTKIAYRRYRVRRLWWLVNKILPLFQARVRGFFQRRIYREMLLVQLKLRSIITIQTCFRRYVRVAWREKKRKEAAFTKFKINMAQLIQKVYWGYKARKHIQVIRNDFANNRLMKAKNRVKIEVAANAIQRVFRGWVARCFRDEEFRKRLKAKRHLALLNRMRRFIQRIMRGKLGRMKAAARRAELAQFALEWASAWTIQRVQRGHIGRLIAREERRLREIRRRNHAATEMQRTFRGYRGRLLAAVAHALKLLRAQMNAAAMEIQRYARGYIGRNQVAHYKEKVERERLELRSCINIQRVFRGHKGREAREIEKELRRAEKELAPLMSHLRGLEDEAVKLQRTINRLTEHVNRLDTGLIEGYRELEHAHHTTNKYTDCTRINNQPQRYLTKYLRVRLKDHLEHEEVSMRKFLTLVCYIHVSTVLI